MTRDVYKLDDRDVNMYVRQALYLVHVHNARQLGAYCMRDGRRVRENMLFRSGMLRDASDEDLRRLQMDYHIETVVDLRTKFELDHMPDRMVPGARYVNMPVEDVDNNIWMLMIQYPGETMHEKLLHFCRSERAKEMTERMYVGFVSDEFCQLQYAAFLDKMLYAKGATLWHCTQGKDRTGLAAAFLLAALGADRETIVRDFALTNVPYQSTVNALAERLFAMGGDERDLAVIQTLEGVNVRYFEDALDYIDTIYGGMDEYLHRVLVLSDEELDCLRNKYLE